ncbi:MAG: helix-turn-helix transcriptional regulator [Ruminococcaceae bacterium]|nr:helix-turn-helix transcriptional regulator [Oscillospiraceae bacterium]
MQDLKHIIAKNIASLRREREMTQFELAEKLNYSDKAISKWERGESVPDIVVLKQIADLFGVTVDWLLEEEHAKPKRSTEFLKNRFKNRSFITCISIVLVWLIAATTFVIADTFRGYGISHYWLSFLFAVPITCIVWLVFNTLWFNKRLNFFIISLLMWSILTCIYVPLLILGSTNIRFIWVLGAIGQIIIILWSRIKRVKKQ